jgi:hypothetical protein
MSVSYCGSGFAMLGAVEYESEQTPSIQAMKKLE